jgi:hypothetical protein
MNTEGLTNPTVRRAIEALQGDRKAWVALFEPDARLYDDGGHFPAYFRFQPASADATGTYGRCRRRTRPALPLL